MITGGWVRAGGKKIWRVLVLAAVLMPSAVRADELRLVAPHLPPFAYLEDGKPRGFMLESLLAVAAQVGHSGKVSVVPIPRMLQEMAEGHRMMTAFLARTPERADRYRWLETGVEEALSFATLASDPGPMTLDRAREFRAIATIGNGVPENFLRARGFNNFDSAGTEDAGLRKLLAGRVEAWFTSQWVIPAVVAAENAPRGLVKLWPPVTRYPLYFAATLDVAPDELAAWAKHLAAFRAAGGIDRLAAPYRYRPEL